MNCCDEYHKGKVRCCNSRCDYNKDGERELCFYWINKREPESGLE